MVLVTFERYNITVDTMVSVSYLRNVIYMYELTLDRRNNAMMITDLVLIWSLNS